ncbi:MAG: efflux RND transporter periplasmic adaptor subunit [Bacteroidales bacterium]|nr:efflux RND transporter periplasmic adaptor subunit [Bacteroidales bacterium]
MKINKIIIASAVAMLCIGCSHKQENKTTDQKVKVETQKVEMLNYSAQNSYNGVVEEDQGVILSFFSGGKLDRINVTEGQFVGQGQLLAQVDEENFRNLHQASQAMKDQAEDAYNRLKTLKDSGSLAEIQWQEVTSKLQQAVSSEQISMKTLKDAKMYAPFSGYIAKKYVQKGENLAPNAPILKLVKIDNVKVKISLPEEEISSVKVGQNVKIKAAALGDRIFNGRIAEKGINADRFSRTYEVKITVNNSDKSLLPGMLCDVYLVGNAPQDVIILPCDVVQMDWDNKPFVWKAVQGKAQKQYVRLGMNVAKGVQVTDGLSVQDEIIIQGQQKVSQGSDIFTDKKG